MNSKFYCWFNPKFINEVIRYIESLRFFNKESSYILSLLNSRLDCLSKIKAFSPDITTYINESYIDLNNIPIDELFKLIKSSLTIVEDKVTAVIIVLNEERCIERCLDSLINSVDEIIVVDTGSTDSTLNILDKYTNIQLYKYSWENDFAKARNFAKSKVTSGWIFFIDADEWLNNSPILGNFLNHFNNFPNIDSLIISPSITNSNEHNSLFIPRIFKSNKNINYFGKIHEELRNADSELLNMSFNLEINHDGYDNNVIDSKEKIHRNISLLKDMIEIEPNNPRWVYFLVRDGFNHLDLNYSKYLINNVLLIKSDSDLSISNLKFNNFTFALVDLLAQIELTSNNLKALDNILPILEHLIPNNSNYVYYNTITTILKIKNTYYNLLVEVIKYRENNFNVQHGMLHSDGYHIDFLIAVLLFECGDYKNSIKYFNFLKDKYTDYGIINHYKYILNHFKGEF